jgi:hypothetical protein
MPFPALRLPTHQGEEPILKTDGSTKAMKIVGRWYPLNRLSTFDEMGYPFDARTRS